MRTIKIKDIDTFGQIEEYLKRKDNKYYLLKAYILHNGRIGKFNSFNLNVVFSKHRATKKQLKNYIEESYILQLSEYIE